MGSDVVKGGELRENEWGEALDAGRMRAEER